MRAPILLKDKDGCIKQRFDSTIDEATVNQVVKMLERAHPNCTVDVSQVELARTAQRHMLAVSEKKVSFNA